MPGRSVAEVRAREAPGPEVQEGIVEDENGKENQGHVNLRGEAASECQARRMSCFCRHHRSGVHMGGSLTSKEVGDSPGKRFPFRTLRQDLTTNPRKRT